MQKNHKQMFHLAVGAVLAIVFAQATTISPLQKAEQEAKSNLGKAVAEMKSIELYIAQNSRDSRRQQQIREDQAIPASEKINEAKAALKAATEAREKAGEEAAPGITAGEQLNQMATKITGLSDMAANAANLTPLQSEEFKLRSDAARQESYMHMAAGSQNIPALVAAQNQFNTLRGQLQEKWAEMREAGEKPYPELTEGEKIRANSAHSIGAQKLYLEDFSTWDRTHPKIENIPIPENSSAPEGATDRQKQEWEIRNDLYKIEANLNKMAAGGSFAQFSGKDVMPQNADALFSNQAILNNQFAEKKGQLEAVWKKMVEEGESPIQQKTPGENERAMIAATTGQKIEWVQNFDQWKAKQPAAEAKPEAESTSDEQGDDKAKKEDEEKEEAGAKNETTEDKPTPAASEPAAADAGTSQAEKDWGSL